MLKFQLLTISLFPILILPSYGQQSEQDSLYAMVYTTGKSWNQDKQPHEQPYFMAHSRHLRKLRKEGKIVMGGRFDDKGFMLLRAKNLDDATLITQRDSSVLYHTFQVALYPFDAFYPGYVGTSRKDVEAEKARVTGLGGFFFKSENPEKLRAWYKDKLGIQGGEQGTSFEWRKDKDSSKPGFTVWHAFGEMDDYFDIGTQEYMINYRVNNLKGLLEELRQKGVTIVGEPEIYEYGTFAWILDLEGRKVELWEPNDEVYDRITKQRMKSN
ncbi:MAG: hypothetical protein WBG48_14845 [Pricia sp.]